MFFFKLSIRDLVLYARRTHKSTCLCFESPQTRSHSLRALITVWGDYSRSQSKVTTPPHQQRAATQVEEARISDCSGVHGE